MEDHPDGKFFVRKIPRKIKNLVKNKQKIKNTVECNYEDNNYQLTPNSKFESLDFQLIQKNGYYSLIAKPILENKKEIIDYQVKKPLAYTLDSMNQKIKNVTTYCTNNKNCKYTLLAPVALRGIENKYRRNIKFDGGSP